MKICVIKKFETITCGIHGQDLWKITSDYNLALKEIKNDVINKREKLNFEYRTKPDLIIVNKVLPSEESVSCYPGELDIKMGPHEWPLFTYVVSEMEVITE